MDGGGGADMITLGFGTWAGYYGGAPDTGCTDPANCAEPLGAIVDNPFAGGTRLYGGAGADTLILNGGTISGDIIGSDDTADSVEAMSSLLDGGSLAGQSLDGRMYSEIFVFSGGSANGYVDAGDGDDLIVLGLIADDGSVRQTTFHAANSYVDAGAGNDEIILQAGGMGRL